MQERAKDTRSRILKSATELFAKQGFAATSVDEISIGAQANKQRIYAYFGSKQKLFESCLIEIFKNVEPFSEKMFTKMEKYPENLTRIIFNSYYNIHEKVPEFLRLLTWANLEGNFDFELLIDLRTHENEKIKKCFDYCIEQGYIRDIEFRFYLLEIMSIAYFVHSNKFTLKKTVGLPTKRNIADNLDMLFKGKL